MEKVKFRTKEENFERASFKFSKEVERENKEIISRSLGYKALDAIGEVVAIENEDGDVIVPGDL